MKNFENLGRWMGGRKDGWKDGWMEAKAGLRIAYSNQKYLNCNKKFIDFLSPFSMSNLSCRYECD